MKDKSSRRPGMAWLALGVFLGLAVLGLQLSTAALDMKKLDRSVAVKGLSERELPADIVIWPIQFSIAGNELASLYQQIDGQVALIQKFLTEQGIADEEISLAPPAITDKSAQQYGTSAPAEFRYTAMQTVTVYSEQTARVRELMSRLSDLGKQGIAFTGANYQAQPEYLFSRLNEIKPDMIEEATRNAREVALKFANDSDSTLGKIRRASQGQFSIQARDKNNPHIKRIRVVSTIEYYLID